MYNTFKNKDQCNYVKRKITAIIITTTDTDFA